MSDGPTYAWLVLPPPISTNALYVPTKTGGITKSKDYRKWGHHADEYMMTQRPLPIFVDPVAITIFAGEEWARVKDSDNVPKAAIDVLTKEKVIKDDNKKRVRRSASVWVPGLEGLAIHVTTDVQDVSAERIMALLSQKQREMVTPRKKLRVVG